jgi:RimJ/RimL family protein N-acetyltransferase
MEDIKDLFNWINNPLSRKNSFRSAPITWQEHEKWFSERLIDTATTIYILCSDKKEKLGSVRFEEKEGGIRISVMLNPDYIGKKLGSELIRFGMERYIQEKEPSQPIIAEIKGDNLPSKKAFLKAGFKEDHSIYIYDR